MLIRWPSFDSRIIRRKKLMCTGELQPDPSFSTYEVRITLEFKRYPVSRVLSPCLQRRSESDAIPHVFDGAKDPRPCLFYKQQWHGSMALSNTIVPWLLEWLYFYEMWQVTGHWHGGGIDHDSTEEKRI